MAARALAGELIRLLRPGGVLLGFYGARASDDPRYTKYIIEDETHLRCRYYTSACSRRWVLQNRDIYILFAGLEICETVLLKSDVREILFRKYFELTGAAWRQSPGQAGSRLGSTAAQLSP
jgi:hypothetical protein